MEPETLAEAPVRLVEAEEKDAPVDGEESTPADSASLDKKETALLTPTTTERTPRERKVVERYSVPSASKPNPKKPISIDKGRGTQLKDIPNVAFKLSKRKADDNLHLLHTILFGKKGKAQTVKRNIGRFSGFVWVKDEEKQRTRVKEKLDKCVKDKLIDFCDVLNIPINKAVVRKEDLSAKLLDFLESPHSTTDVVLSDKEKGQKRKRNVTPGKPSASKEASSDVTEKKQKRVLNSAKKQRKSSQSDEDDVNDEVKTDDSEDETHTRDDAVALSKEEYEDEKGQSGKEEDQPTAHGPDKSASHKDMENEESKGNDEVGAETKVVPPKSSRNKSSLRSKKGTSDTSADKSLSKSGESASKKQKSEKRNQKDEGASSKMKTSGQKRQNKSSAKAQVTDGGKGKNKKKPKAEPSREEMHAVVVDILKEVDFNTATLSDILKQLGEHFGIDLMHRKAELKDIITEVINNMTDDEDDGEVADNNAEADRDD
ncbi:hypothetical protein MLD38_026065 [Melastoma candidum]|uniref:Uncharacterized protein n=1 Tax=Melastoma candidum TaxID=119954 RepID=A0ACB9NYZ9_9MYRT|nr:hypothetical protein MLD38_026065 [Melastoma candidum]